MKETSPSHEALGGSAGRSVASRSWATVPFVGLCSGQGRVPGGREGPGQGARWRRSRNSGAHACPLLLLSLAVSSQPVVTQDPSSRCHPGRRSPAPASTPSHSLRSILGGRAAVTIRGPLYSLAQCTSCTLTASHGGAESAWRSPLHLPPRPEPRAWISSTDRASRPRRKSSAFLS